MSITLLLIIVTCLISYQGLERPGVNSKLLHLPYQVVHGKEYYRLLSSGFVHRDYLHLIINMYVLYVFGESVEREFVSTFGELSGRLNFLLLYIMTILFSDIPSLIKHRNNPGYGSLGASGAVSGVVLVYVLFFPWNKLLLFFIIPMPAIVMAVVFLIYSSWASRRGHGNINHDAHFYGAVFGFLFTLALKPDLFGLFIDRLIQQSPF